MNHLLFPLPSSPPLQVSPSAPPSPLPVSSAHILPFPVGESLPAMTGQDLREGPEFRSSRAPSVADVQASARMRISLASSTRGVTLDPAQTALAIELAVMGFAMGNEVR